MSAQLGGESPIERVFELANQAAGAGLIGECAIGGAFAFICYGEPFETKHLDLFVSFRTGATGLIDPSPLWHHFVAGGAVPERPFLRLSRLLVDFVPVSDALDAEALRSAPPIQVGGRPACSQRSMPSRLPCARAGRRTG